jgi:hypothetical protein
MEDPSMGNKNSGDELEDYVHYISGNDYPLKLAFSHIL